MCCKYVLLERVQYVRNQLRNFLAINSNKEREKTTLFVQKSLFFSEFI